MGYDYGYGDMENNMIQSLKEYSKYNAYVTIDGYTNAEKMVCVDDVNELVTTLFRGHLENIHSVDDVRLVLRPMEDIYTEICVNGEWFIPINKLKSIFGIEPSILQFTHYGVKVDGICFYSDMILIIEKLREMFFDVDGLLQSSLALNYNETILSGVNVPINAKISNGTYLTYHDNQNKYVYRYGEPEIFKIESNVKENVSISVEDLCKDFRNLYYSTTQEICIYDSK